uniref:Uncharacterized protein n=1 Tax=Romanomermis culicivorax TaxID=13658 RepID=A0A915K340_ROMCU
MNKTLQISITEASSFNCRWTTCISDYLQYNPRNMVVETSDYRSFVIQLPLNDLQFVFQFFLFGRIHLNLKDTYRLKPYVTFRKEKFLLTVENHCLGGVKRLSGAFILAFSDGTECNRRNVTERKGNFRPDRFDAQRDGHYAPAYLTPLRYVLSLKADLYLPISAQRNGIQSAECNRTKGKFSLRSVPL